MQSVSPLLGFLSLGAPEMVVILIVGLLVFGRRLPEVGRQLGRSFLEFRKGLNSFRREMELDDDLRHTRDSVRELQREITRPIEVEPWSRSRSFEEVEPRNDDLDHGPLAADRGAVPPEVPPAETPPVEPEKSGDAALDVDARDAGAPDSDRSTPT